MLILQYKIHKIIKFFEQFGLQQVDTHKRRHVKLLKC